MRNTRTSIDGTKTKDLSISVLGSATKPGHMIKICSKYLY
jgi:hypothetical protein